MNEKENIKLKKGFTQICVWPGTTMGDAKPELLVKHIKEQFDVRIQFLEVIFTKPDIGDPETGGRSDIFFAIHSEDVMKFAIPRLAAGIRWLEDVLAPCNYSNSIYPVRVFEYQK